MNMLHTRDEYFAEHGHDCIPSVSTIALILGGYYFCSNGCVLALFDSEHARHRSLRGPGMRVRRYRAIPGPAPPPRADPGLRADSGPCRAAGGRPVIQHARARRRSNSMQ